MFWHIRLKQYLLKNLKKSFQEAKNTRLKDFYDVYILNTLKKQNTDNKILKEAFAAMVKKCGTKYIVSNYKEIIKTVASSTVMNNQWTGHQKNLIMQRILTLKISVS